MGAETRVVKPRKGLIVRDPNTKAILPDSGTEVPWVGASGKYFRRRLKQGDIEIISAKNIDKIENDEIIKEAVLPKEAVRTFKKYDKKEDKI